MNAGKMYLKGVHQRFSHLGTWLPNANLRLGDVGFQKGEEFKQMTTLKDLGIPMTLRRGASRVDFTYTSQSGVKLQTKAKGVVAVGTTLPVAEAGIAIQFSQEGAFVFQAIGCIVDEIENKVELGDAVMKLIQQGKWEADWSVVDTIVKADCATILVSNSASSALELTAKTPVETTNLANLEAGFSVNSQSGDILRFIAEKGLTPLFKLSRVKKSFLPPWLGGSKPITFGGGIPEHAVAVPAVENVFESVAPEA